jgi:hypothetical protein
MEPISKPGWYRIVVWEPVNAAAAEAEIEAGGGQDLILIREPGPGKSYQSDK